MPPETLWSILVPTVPERVDVRRPLMDSLHRQAAEHPEVEVLLVEDNRSIPYHAKLNRMAAIASGVYVSYVDDDDWIADDYVAAIVAALRRSPEVDAVLFDTVWTLDDGPPVAVHYGLGNPVRNGPDGFYRPPEQRHPIRREIILSMPYKPPDYGADTNWALSVDHHRLIRSTCAPENRSIGAPPLYHHRERSGDPDGIWAAG